MRAKVRDLCVFMVLDDVDRNGPASGAVLARRVSNSSSWDPVIANGLTTAIREATERGELAHDASDAIRMTPKGVRVLTEQRGYWKQLLPGLRRAVA